MGERPLELGRLYKLKCLLLLSISSSLSPKQFYRRGSLPDENKPFCRNWSFCGGEECSSMFDAVAAASHRTGGQFNRLIFGLSFCLKNGLRFRFDSETCLNYPFLEHFLSVGNLKPKLKWFLKPKLKPIFFY